MFFNLTYTRRPTKTCIWCCSTWKTWFILLFSATCELTCSYKQYIICLATRCLNLWINSNLSEAVTENKNKKHILYYCQNHWCLNAFLCWSFHDKTPPTNSIGPHAITSFSLIQICNMMGLHVESYHNTDEGNVSWLEIHDMAVSPRKICWT